MTPHTFDGYGVNAPSVTIILERVTHWWHIDFNGNYGTEIELDTGKSVRVREYHGQVEKIVRAAVNGGADRA